MGFKDSLSGSLMYLEVSNEGNKSLETEIDGIIALNLLCTSRIGTNCTISRDATRPVVLSSLSPLSASNTCQEMVIESSQVALQTADFYLRFLNEVKLQDFFDIKSLKSRSNVTLQAGSRK